MMTEFQFYINYMPGVQISALCDHTHIRRLITEYVNIVDTFDVMVTAVRPDQTIFGSFRAQIIEAEALKEQ